MVRFYVQVREKGTTEWLFFTRPGDKTTEESCKKIVEKLENDYQDIYKDFEIRIQRNETQGG